MLTKLDKTVGFHLWGERRPLYKDPVRTSQIIIPNTVSDNIMEREDGTSIIDSTGTVAAAGTTIAALTDTNIAGPAGGEILIYDGVNSWDNQAMSGDMTLSAAGAIAFNGAIIVDADVAAGAAIAYSKLAALTSANILVGSAGNVATVTAVTGDVAITNGGVTTVTDLTIAGEVQGNIIYFNGTNWVRLAVGAAGESLLTQGAGANPTWGTPSVASATVIANNATLNDAGGFDAVLSFTEQTVGSPTLTVPDFANVDDTFCFITLAQTLVNKTLTAPAITGGSAIELTTFSLRDTAAAFDVIIQSTSTGILADRTLTLDVGNANRTVTLAGAVTTAGDFITSGAFSLTLTTTAGTNVTLPTTGTLATLAGTETLTNKTLTTPVIASMLFSAGGNAITLQNAVHTVVGRDTTDTLTNKTLDADGTGNVLSNVNADELDPIVVPTGAAAADAVYAVPSIIMANISNQAAAVNIYGANAPFAFHIVRAWSVNASADGGTWKLNNGALGVGTDITNAVTVAANDEDIDEPTDYNNAVQSIALNGSLSIVPDGAGLLDCMIYIEIVRGA